MLNECLVLTSNGIVNRSSLTIKHNIINYNKEYINIKSISYAKQKHVIEVQDSIDDNVFYLENDESILIYKDDKLVFTKATELEVDNWIFHPWIEKSISSSIPKIDLSLYSENLKDKDNIYVFNHELLEVAKKFNLTPHALKDILTRESADYETYIPKVKKYIEDNYCNFKDISQYASKHFTYKMPRFLDTDTESFITVLAALTFYTVDRYTLNTDDIASYILTTSIPVSVEHLFHNTLNSFFKKLNVKYEFKKVDQNCIFTVFNKPFYELYSKYLKYSLHFLSNQREDLQELFIKLTPKNIESNLSLRLAIALKEFYFYNRKIYSLNSSSSVNLIECQDDLHNLNSNLIVDELGYYTQVISLNSNLKIITSQITNTMITLSGVIKLA